MVEAMKPVKRYGHLSEDEVAELWEELQAAKAAEVEEEATRGA